LEATVTTALMKRNEFGQVICLVSGLRSRPLKQTNQSRFSSACV